MTGPDRPPTPPRTRVTSPRLGAARRRQAPGTSEIDAQTRVGEIYMASLVRAQLRLAGVVLGVLVVTVGGLPLLFALAPGLTRVRLSGVPLPWLLLAVAVYPLLLGLGWLFVRAAERNERDFAYVVQRRP
ncbi:MAG: hypothetical protein WB441_10265 [Nocardioidaceae bacterium]